MQACSLLLGRPWQYDNSVIHHGRTNSYTLMFEGKTIQLLPMNPIEIVNSEKARAPGNTKVDDVHALLALNSPIHDVNIPSDERVPSDHDNLDCMHEIATIIFDALLKYKQLFVSTDTCFTYIRKCGCLFGFALFSWFSNFQAMESRGRLCFQEGEDDEDTDVIDIAKTITDISIYQVISFYIFIIINLINGNKNTILACVLCRTLEGMNTYVGLVPYMHAATTFSSIHPCNHAGEFRVEQAWSNFTQDLAERATGSPRPGLKDVGPDEYASYTRLSTAADRTIA
jgi:hypothetical protein